MTWNPQPKMGTGFSNQSSKSPNQSVRRKGNYQSGFAEGRFGQSINQAGRFQGQKYNAQKGGHFNKINNTGQNNNGSWKGKFNNRNNSKNTSEMSPYCPLCGFQGHTAASGCPYMQTDQGKRVTVWPTSYACTKCPANQKALRHPEEFCPFRINGPLALKDNKIPDKSSK